MLCPIVAKAQGQYIPVETKPASSAAKVMDSTKVVYVVVDKDKLKPVDPNDPPGRSLLSTLKIPSELIPTLLILWKCLLFFRASLSQYSFPESHLLTKQKMNLKANQVYCRSCNNYLKLLFWVFIIIIINIPYRIQVLSGVRIYLHIHLL